MALAGDDVEEGDRIVNIDFDSEDRITKSSSMKKLKPAWQAQCLWHSEE